MDRTLAPRGMVVAVLLALWPAAGAAAQGPIIDGAFGDGGRVVTPIGTTSEGHFDLIVSDPLGGAMAAGTTRDRAGPRIAIVRLTPSGERDRAWGDAGEVLVDFEGHAIAIARQSTGAVVVLIGLRGWAGHTALIRVTADGRPDAEFGPAGIRRLPDGPTVLATDAADRLVLAAAGGSVRRLTADGDPDPSFGEDGTAEVGPGSPQALVVAGASPVIAVWRGSEHYEVVRLTADGTLDPAFGTEGTTRLPVTDGAAWLALASDGGVLAGAGAFLYKLDAGGALDPSFGSGGRIVFSRATIRGVGSDATGRILVLATEGLGNGVRRFSATGQADTTFGPGTDTGVRSTYLALATSPLGPLVLGASLAIPEGVNSRENALVTRFAEDGSRDRSYGGSSGRAKVVAGEFSWGMARAAVDLDGSRTLVAGWAFEGDVHHIALVSYRADGSLDPSFGDDGQVMVPALATAMDVERFGEGAVVAGYVASTQRPRFEAYAVGADGSLRPGFGVAGVAAAEVPGDVYWAVTRAVAVDSAGRVVLAGEIDRVDEPENVAVVRLLADGTPDPAFGDEGWAIVHIGDRNDHSNPVALHVGEKDAVTVIASNREHTPRIAALRLTADGELDSTFGEDGIVTVAGSDRHLPRDTAMMSDGGIVVVGDGGDGRTWLLRIGTDGWPDPTFGPGGFARISSTSPSGTPVVASAVGVDGTGRIVVGASNSLGNGQSRSVLMRVLPSGMPDPAWGPGGQVFGPPSDSRTIAGGDLVLPAEGRYVLAATRLRVEGWSFAALGWRDPPPPAEVPPDDDDPPDDQDPPDDEDPPDDIGQPNPPVGDDPPAETGPELDVVFPAKDVDERPKRPTVGDRGPDVSPAPAAERADAPTPSAFGSAAAPEPRRPAIVTPTQRLAVAIRRGVLVRIACSVACRLRLSAGAGGRTVTLPAGGRVAVRLRLRATERRRLARSAAPVTQITVGSARLRIALRR